VVSTQSTTRYREFIFFFFFFFAFMYLNFKLLQNHFKRSKLSPVGNYKNFQFRQIVSRTKQNNMPVLNRPDILWCRVKVLVHIQGTGQFIPHCVIITFNITHLTNIVCTDKVNCCTFSTHTP
jgi:hypothetical protein